MGSLFYYYNLNNIYTPITIFCSKEKQKIKNILKAVPPWNFWKKNRQKCLNLHRVAELPMVHQNWDMFILGEITVSTRLSCPPAHSAESPGGLEAILIMTTPPCWEFPCIQALLGTVPTELIRPCQQPSKYLSLGIIYRWGTEVHWISLLEPVRKGWSWDLNQGLLMLKLCVAVCSSLIPGARPLIYNN